MGYRWKMNFSRDVFKHLSMPYTGLFKYKKEGIILNAHYMKINLTELFKSDPEGCIELLERLEETDIDKYRYDQIIEVKKDFIEEYLNNK